MLNESNAEVIYIFLNIALNLLSICVDTMHESGSK